MPTVLTCYGAVGEIGGNKLLLEDGERRAFFDFGKAFGRYGAYFDGVFIKERAARGLLDPLALGLIPPLRGLLRDDLVPALDADALTVTEAPPTGRQRKPRTQVQAAPRAVEAFWDSLRRQSPGAFRDLRRGYALPVDRVYLSHAHQDHISDLEYVSADIPAASSRMTAFISKVLLDTGQAGRSGAPFVNPRVLNAQGMLKADSDQGYQARPWAFLDGDPEGVSGDDPLASPAAFWALPAVKRLEPRRAEPLARWPVRHWPVDHSLFGAVGLAVETEAGWVAYSGDLRFHGRQADLSWRFADALASLQPTVLLCEGTRLTEPNRTSEADVFERCLEAVRRGEGRLVVADFAPRNFERLEAFLDIAAETGRRLLLQPKDAYLLRAIHLADPNTPDLMTDPHAGLFDDPKVREFAWEEKVRARYRATTWGSAVITRRPGEFILACSLTDVADLLDLQHLVGGGPGGVYIFSNSQAYDDEQKVDLVRLWNWTQHLGLQMVGLRPSRRGARGEVIEVLPEPGYHASGHAGSDELVEFVRRARPKRLVPIHTETPERWGDLLAGTGIEVTLPVYGQPMTLG